MTMTYWLKVASVLLVAGVATSEVAMLVARDEVVAATQPQADDPPRSARPGGGATTEVRPGRLTATVTGRGRLEASRALDAFSNVEGQNTIITLKPEGTRVLQGELVCALDSASLKDQLISQMIKIRQAEAAHANARRAREAADIAAREYAEGIYPRDLRAASDRVDLARADIARAEAQRDRAQRARERIDALRPNSKEAATPADVVADLEIADRIADAERAIDRAQRALEAGQARRDVLERFTRDRTVKHLSVAAEEARASELARESTLALERSKAAKTERQIANCQIHAPGDGVVVYANTPNRIDHQQNLQIEEGATIRERQKIFSLTDLGGPTRVVALIPEALVGQVKPGQEARIGVDGVPGETLLGTVEAVAARPDPATLRAGDRSHPTTITLSRSDPALRPGMTTRVLIVVAVRDDVLKLPVGAVVRLDGKDHVAIPKPDGGADWREVTLGLTDGKSVEIKAGLRAGEVVADDPAALLSDDQKSRLSPPSR